jgi:hypothetical protein
MAELPIPLPLLIGIVILALAEGGYISEEARRCVRVRESQEMNGFMR